MLPADASAGQPQESLSLRTTSYHGVYDWLSTCPYASTLTGYSQTLACSVLIATQCNTWSCPVCGRRKISALAHLVGRAQPNRLCTLTVVPNLHGNPRSTYEHTAKKLTTLVRDIRRDFGPWEHLRVVESTKKGWPHYHLVVRSEYVPHQYVARRWRELTGAFIVDLRQIKDAQNVYWYVVKYLAKQTAVRFTQRRVSLTRGFCRDPPRDTPEPLDLADLQRDHRHPARYATDELSAEHLTHYRGHCWIIGQP